MPCEFFALHDQEPSSPMVLADPSVPGLAACSVGLRQANVPRRKPAFTVNSIEPQAAAELDLIVPVYNEGPNIGRALEEIYQHVALPKRVLIVYDFDEDDTVPVVRELAPKYPGVELVKNTLGRGVVNAVRAGIA